jgi:hypothetical protein
MSTHDVPGANAINKDVLAAGCWAEHDDGSLLYVKGTEGKTVVYELYDLDQQPPVYYQDAMRKKAFKSQFSWPPIGTSTEQWTWHDKTPFPWSRVMGKIDKPRPVHANVADQLSAATRVAKSLQLRARKVQEADLDARTETEGKIAGRTIMDRLSRAFERAYDGFNE